jgi:thiamine pyrophosphate-dependent acetolactate synthase large subunit-like protein
VEAEALAEAVRALGVPVYLSGMARGLLGAADPLQMRHRRKEALREADLVILAGVPCDFRLDYGSHIGRRAALVSANRSRERDREEPASDARRPRGARSSSCAASPAGSRDLPRQWAAWRDELRARDAARDAEIAAQAAADTPGGLQPAARPSLA